MSVTSVTLGNFYTTNSGKNVLGGAGGSGLDEQSLITSLTNASEAQATQDNTQITANNAKVSAFNQLQSLLTTYQSAAAALSNPQGISNLSNNVFASTVASVGNGGSSYVSVTTAPGAATQSYDISDITSMATSASQLSGTFDVANANADATTGSGAVFTPGTITFADGAAVTVNSGDSLNTIVSNFNAVSSTTGITASVIQAGTDQYVLSFTATNTGTGGNFDLSSSGTTISSGQSVLSSIGLQSAVTGTNANFKLNGVQISSQTNSNSNIINDVTIGITQVPPSATDTYPVTISPDTSTVTTAINNFVSAYNAIQTFAAQQTQLSSSGTFASSAVLAEDPTFESIINNVDQQVESQVAGIASGSPNSLADIGITFTNQAASGSTPAVSNLLTVNASTLATELSTNFSGVQNVFGINSTSSNGDFALYSTTQAVGVSNFTVNIDPGTNTFTATYTQNGQSVTTDLNATPLTGFANGYSLTGAAGSALAGTTFLYTDNDAATINMTITQGIADQANNFATSALTTSTGSIAVAITGLQNSNSQLNTDITNVKAQASAYQQQLISEYSALEQAISSNDTLLQSLNANSNAALEAANA